MRSIGKTDIGLVRKVNEDCFLCQKLDVDNTYLYIVADGMGGHNAGEVASSMAVNEILYYIKHHYEDLDQGSEKIYDLIISSIMYANDKIYKKSILNNNCLGMGTTLSMALLKDNVLYIGHVGDSRVYLIRDRQINKLTEDHSLVAELIRMGTIKPEEANSHPQKNVITRALGTEYTIDVDVSEYKIENNDYIVLCTDGLTNVVDEIYIMETVLNEENIEVACDTLIERAKNSGGYDNITAIIIQICKGGDCDDR